MSRRDFAHFSAGEIIHYSIYRCRSRRRVATKPTHLPRRNGGCNATFIWILYFSQNICGAGHNSASPTQPKQWRQQQQQHQRVPKGSSTCARIYMWIGASGTHTHMNSLETQLKIYFFVWVQPPYRDASVCGCTTLCFCNLMVQVNAHRRFSPTQTHIATNFLH